jgi:hypothetical protein
MDRALKEGETAIRYIPKFREYGIAVLDGGDSFLQISFCPWCGSELPARLRDKWFETLESLGLAVDSPSIPQDLKSDNWWKSEQT